MMIPSILKLVVGLSVCVAECCLLAAGPESSPKPLTGKPWEDMDYGPFLTASIEAPSPRTNIAYKGIAIPVGQAVGSAGGEAVLFDTDLLRFAAGWTGEFVALKGVVFDGEHWAYPQIAGRQVFSNPMQPGWAKAGSFVDPREQPFGPLPRDWAKWRGLYLHGEQVVLSYSVGGVEVLESPGIERLGGATAFRRAFNRGPSLEAQDLQLVFEAGARGGVVSRDQLASVSAEASAASTLAVLEMGGEVLAAGLVGGPEQARWLTGDPGHLRLRLPAASEPMHFKVLLWRGPREALGDFAALARQSPQAEDLSVHTRGGAARWPERLTTRGQRGSDDGPYAIDTLTTPDDNPWHSWLRFGGLDFFADGRRMALCTWNGDVWTVDGVDGDLAKLDWQRIATGLFQPLGLKIVRDQIYVLGRDQITRLHDLNGDGEADFYENFNNDCMVSEHFHEFATDLKTDRDGNFYYAKCARHALPASHPHHGTLLKVSPDGERLEVVARGFRAINGIGVGPRGELTTVDNQGHWMPGNRINWVQPGGWYGNQWAWNPQGRTNYDEPLLWMHNFVDRSGGGHVWVPDERWGPFKDQLITISYGMGHMFLVLREEVNGVRQGGVTRFPLEFETGVMRGVFHPGDGQLYTCGLYGWAGNKTRSGGVYRVRATGKPKNMPASLHVAKDGLIVGFTDPLDEQTATDPGNFDVTAWNYIWSANYGSPDIKPDGKEGRERLGVESASLSADRRTVFLKLPGIQPVMQMHVVFKLRAADGVPFENFIHNSVHRLGAEPGLQTLGQGALVRSLAKGDESVKATAPGLVQRVELIDPRKVSQATPAVSRVEVPDVRRVRVPAVLVREGAPPTPFLAPGRFRSTWTGLLRMDLNSSRQLSLVGRGSARLIVNGKALLEVADLETTNMASASIQLRGGLNQFELTYESPSVGDAELRVRWSGEGSPIEPIPATAFVHDAAQPELVRGEQMRAGRRLFHQRQCVKCHQPDAEQAATLTAELRAGGPALDGVGDRFSQAWLAAYLAAPGQSREDVLMPRVLHGSPEQVASDARDVAAFLATLKGVAPPESGPAQVSTAAAGKALFQQLNCAACHTLAGDERLTDDTRLNLADVPAKWNAVALSAFLAKPSRDWGWTRMPDFRLTADEAGALAVFLLAQPHSQSPALAVGVGDAVRGRELVSKSGCLNCHALGGLETRFTAPSLAAIGNSDWQRGCVADGEASRGGAPDFGFAPAELAALREFSQTDWLGALQRETAGEFAERNFTALRCNACHARDGIPEFASRLKVNVPPAKSAGADEEEEGSGSVHLGRPDLTFAGEKLHGEWMQRLLAGRLGYRTRTEVQGRMPAFPAYGQMMGAGLAEQHGMTVDRGPAPRSDEALAAIGQRLTRVEGGFGCVSCHDVGQQRALAGKDTATINFAFVTDRLQPAYFWRYIRDPQRFRPGTMMPSFIAEDGSTPIKQVFDGDSSRQFEAIWQYLMSLTPADAAVTP